MPSHRAGLSRFVRFARLLAIALACASAAGAQRTAAPFPRFLEQPRLVADPTGTTPLAAEVSFRTHLPTSASLFIDDGIRRILIPNASLEEAEAHSIPVIGLLPGRTHHIRVIATTAEGFQTTSREVIFSTPLLPIEFPPIVTSSLDRTLKEPGYTLFGTLARPPLPGGVDEFSVILDAEGEVVWFQTEAQGPTRRRNGNRLVAGRDRVVFEEHDPLGRVVKQWFADALLGNTGAPPGATLVDADTFHHEFTELPEGSDAEILFLDSELRVLSDYPADESDLSITTATANVIGDVIVEMRADGTIVRRKSLLDILDPYRIGYDSLTVPFWNTTYGTLTRDWSHANSVTIDPSDNTYVVSVRHQDCIVKIKRDTPGSGSPSDVVWILGNHDGWRSPWDSKLLQPVPLDGSSVLEFEWPFHQHAARVQANGDLICYDNGNYRTTPPNGAPPPSAWYSRAVEYRVDEANGTVQQLWATGGLFDTDLTRLGIATFVSNAERLPVTGNVLVDSGGSQDFALGSTFTRIQELTHETPARTAMDISVQDPTGMRNWITYRAHHLASLYPQPEEQVPLAITVGPLEVGHSVTIQATGDLRPGETVYVAFSEHGRIPKPAGFPGAAIGKGPCLDADTCLEIVPPLLSAGTGIVDPSGTAYIESPRIPRETFGAYSFQAWVLRGPQHRDSVVSPVITAFVGQ